MAAYFAFRQQAVMQNQLNESQAEQRAWISLAGDPAITEPLILDSSNNLVRTAAKFLVRNSGRNPAIDTSIEIEAAAFKTPNKESVTAVCNSAHTSPDYPWNLGVSVFPSDQHYLGEGISIKRSDILNATKNIPGADKAIGIPSVVVCIVYTDAVTRQLHHTPYVFSLLHISAGTGHLNAISLDQLPIDAKEVGLVEEPLTFIPPD